MADRSPFHLGPALLGEYTLPDDDDERSDVQSPSQNSSHDGRKKAPPRTAPSNFAQTTEPPPPPEISVPRENGSVVSTDRLTVPDDEEIGTVSLGRNISLPRDYQARPEQSLATTMSSVPLVSVPEGEEEDVPFQDEQEKVPEKPAKAVCQPISLFWKFVLVLVLFTVLNVVLVWVIVSNNSNNEQEMSSPSPPSASPSASSLDGTTTDPSGSTTIGKIKEAGSLKCGVDEDKKVFFDRATLTGFEADLCKAIAAAIFGDPMSPPVEFITVTTSNRFQKLRDGEVDILASQVTRTMDRDVFESSSRTGFTFSTPYLYDGVGFAGTRQNLECAENLNTSLHDVCSDFTICVLQDTTHADVVESLFTEEEASPVKQDDLESIYERYNEGLCNVIAGEQFDLAQAKDWRDEFPELGKLEVGTRTFSSEPLALVTRDGDAVWSDFVEWILQVLLSAEEEGKSNGNLMPTTTLFGDDLQFMFQHAVSAAGGNYGDLYTTYLEALVPRSDMNQINTNSTGLQFALPFGQLDVLGDAPVAGSTLERIFQRGHLRCGVSRFYPLSDVDHETQEWSGLDVSFCRAVSAAIFNGIHDTVVFIALPATERFVALANGQVDLLSRQSTWTYERDVKEPTSQVGLSFSHPYFYSGLAFGGVPPYGDCADRLKTTGSCEGLMICVNDGTTTLDRLRELFKGQSDSILPKPTAEEAQQGLIRGDCNAIAGDLPEVIEQNLIDKGYNDTYEVGSRRFSKEPLALVTRQDDAHFTSFVDWILMATIYAEANGITQATAGEEMPLVSLFGPLFTRMFADVIQAVGNYGEIYDRNAVLLRGSENRLNTLPYTAQHYPIPGLF